MEGGSDALLTCAGGGDSPAPHSLSPAELASLLEAERKGEAFLAYRDGDGDLRVGALEGFTSVTIVIAVAFPGEHLQCDPATLLAVPGAVDSRHSTTAEDSLDDVAAHHCPCLERHEFPTRIQ